jgi:hypothetical protein
VSQCYWASLRKSFTGSLDARDGDMRVLTNILRLASVPVGVAIGLWTAQLQSFQPCPPYMRCPSPATLVLQPTFAAWECALFGAGAAVMLVLVAEAVARLRSPS